MSRLEGLRLASADNLLHPDSSLGLEPKEDLMAATCEAKQNLPCGATASGGFCRQIQKRRRLMGGYRRGRLAGGGQLDGDHPKGFQGC